MIGCDLGQFRGNFCRFISISGGLFQPLANGIDIFFKRRRLLFQSGNLFCSLSVGRAIDCVDAFLRDDVGNLLGQHHVDGRITCKLIGHSTARFGVVNIFGVRALIVVSGKQFIAIHDGK